jgi:hypothetical protein
MKGLYQFRFTLQTAKRNHPMSDLRISAEARSRIFAALKAHKDWPTYRQAHSLPSFDAISKAQYVKAAADLGIDVFALVEGVPPQPQKQTFQGPISRAEADEMERRPAPQPQGDRSDAAQELASVLARVMGQAPIDRAAVEEIAREAIRAELEKVPGIKIVFSRDGRETGKVEGHQHPKFKTLARATSARQADGFAPNVWLSGPAGSGKTTAAKMLARALDLPFHFNGAVGMVHELTGFIDAAGKYHSTAFRDAFENGGVYVFDEVDGSDNAALLALNAALANGMFRFPDKTVERHAECIIIATANTWGGGATADYVGRAKIDAAFLSRFPVRIQWDYDSALEIALAGDYADWARRVQAARERARNAGLKVLICPRITQAGAALLAAGMSADDAAECTYLANLTRDQRKIVEGA